MLLASLALMMLVPQETTAPPPSGRVAEILKSGDGKSEATAYKVKSVHEEYEVLGALGLRPGGQSLIVHGKKAFDMLSVTDPKTQQKQDIYFDINSFYWNEGL